MGFPQARILEWVAISFSRGVFPTQESNLCLLQWKVDSLPLSHQGSHTMKIWKLKPQDTLLAGANEGPDNVII